MDLRQMCEDDGDELDVVVISRRDQYGAWTGSGTTFVFCECDSRMNTCIVAQQNRRMRGMYRQLGCVPISE